MLTLLIVGIALSAALMVYLINRAIGPDDEDEPELDPITRALVVATDLATVEGNEAVAAAVRSLNQLYLFGFEHLAAGALAREVVCAKIALEVADEPLPFNLCLQGHRHDSSEVAQACNVQAAEDRQLMRFLASSTPGVDTDGERFLRGLEECDRHPGGSL